MYQLQLMYQIHYKLIVSLLISIVTISLMGCGKQLYEDGNELEEVQYARLICEDYFGVLIDDNVHITTLEQVQQSCGANAAACNHWGVIVIHYDIPEYICQQAAHEFGHSATHELFEDWDYNHTIAYDYYFDFIFNRCRIYQGKENGYAKEPLQ